jgi:hypothetical protein
LVPVTAVKVYSKILKRTLVGIFWNEILCPLSVEIFSHLFFLWQENLGSVANLDQKKSDLGDSEVENSEFIG